MPPLTRAPSPQQFADAWTRGLAKAVRDAAGSDGRLSRNEARAIGERGDALARYGDNVDNWFDKTGQKSVSVGKLIASGHAYAEANGYRVAGSNQRMSLVEARNLPADLRADFFELRGKGAPTSSSLPSAADLQAGLSALLDSPMGAYFDDSSDPSITTSSAASVDEVVSALEADVGIFDSVHAAHISSFRGAAALDSVLDDLSEFASFAVDPAEQADAEAGLAALRDVAAKFGDDVEWVSVSRSMGRESWDSEVLVLGAGSGEPLLLELPHW